jgi:hypothetical protein
MSLKMFVPVALLLLVSYSMAALTSPATTPRYDVNQTKEIPTEFQKWLTDSIEDLKKHFEDAEKEWLTICQKAGVKNASVVDTTAFGNAKSCIENAIEIPKLVDIVYGPKIFVEINEFLFDLRNNCELGLKLSGCFSKFLIDIEPCIEGEKAWLNEIRRLADVIPSFLCDNKSHNIDVFIEGKGQECVESKRSNISSCERTTGEATIPETKDRYSSLNETNPLKKAFIKLFNPETCKKYHIFIQCAVKEMRTCSNSKPADVYESFYKTVFIPACNITITP